MRAQAAPDRTTNFQRNFVADTIRRVKYTLGIINWAQYKSRCACTESLTGIADAKEYKALLGVALDCATLWKVEAKQAGTINKADNSGKFKDEHTYPE